MAENNRSALKDFISSISTIKGDLSSITAPPFIIADRSAVEYPASWAEFSEILVAPALEEDAEKRALLVLKWYLTSLKRQQYAGGREDIGIKKPLNPFLGELFLGNWTGDYGTTLLISEQVSHHPPVTACYIINDKYNVQAEGYTAQEITLTKTGSVSITQVGHAMLSIPKFNEKYLVTLPSVLVKGLLTGSTYPELSGKAYIASTGGYIAEIDFSGKTLGFGKKNAVTASLCKQSNQTEILYKVAGQWNAELVFTDERTGETLETIDTNSLKPTEIQVSDPSQQDPWESRRAWQGVIQAVRSGDMQGIATEKSKVEQAQRKLAADREARNEEWHPKFFSMEGHDSEFEKLAKIIGEDFGYERTGGVWKYDTEKAKVAEKPFYGDTTPTG